MSIHNSYFSKNNTILSNSDTNTGRNPVTEIFYGSVINIQYPYAFSRFIFNLDLDLLQEKYDDGTLSNCGGNITHTLRMTNTTSFSDYLNTQTSQGRQRATSFDLILFRIPFINNNQNTPQLWDEGVGYDYADLIYETLNDKNFSYRPSNWFKTTTIDSWTEPGIYDNTNNGTVNYNDLQIIDTQHFQFGNENVSFDMTNEINSILNGSLNNVSGWGIAYKPQVENLTGLTDTYEVQFFTRHTQTFYEPYLESSYDDLIEDDRNTFTLGKTNKLYLYVYDNGQPVNLDSNPTVTINSSNGSAVPNLVGLNTCQKTKGVYEVTIPPLLGYKTPCTFFDKWTNLNLNGFTIPDITNEFTLYPLKNSIQISSTSSAEPKLYGFDFYGLKQDEKNI